MENRWQEAWLQKYYFRRKNWIGGTTEFHETCRKFVASGSSILEVGSGPTNQTTEKLRRIGIVTGLDIDPDVQSNAHLSFHATYDGGGFPFPAESFDAVVSNYVLEHVEQPEQHVREIRRVLKPGGVFIFRTPNLFHYVSLTAAMTPHWFHELFANRLRGLPQASHDPYPTYYLCNSKRAIQRFSKSVGFRVQELRFIEKQPSYGLSSRLLFLTFLGYERLVNSTELLSGLRSNIIGVLQKTDA